MKIKHLFLISCLLISCGYPNESNSTNINKYVIDSFKIANSDSTEVNNKCDYDNNVSNLGIGLIISPAELKIYNDSLLTDSFLNMNIENPENINSKVCPKYFYPEYTIMHFICIGRFGKAYKVLINYSETKYLPNTYNFITWKDYILSSFGIRRSINNEGKITFNQPLRLNPNENADTQKIPDGLESFCPLDVVGDWVKVKYDCFYNESDNIHEGEPCSNYISECKQPLTGWIKWKSGNKILIDIFLMP